MARNVIIRLCKASISTNTRVIRALLDIMSTRVLVLVCVFLSRLLEETAVLHMDIS